MEPSKILVVDDEEDILTVVRLAATRLGGWQVLVAASGEQGLSVAARERPDLILLDVMMPGLDGPATLARLRAQHETASIPVVFLTAKSQDEEVRQLLALGAAGVIRKPFDPLKLPEELRRIARAL